MRIASVVNDSIVDGPGMRFTVFTQGCFHNCTDCHNPQTHDPNGGEDATVESLVEKMAGNPLLAGLTLSGGEPFLQGEPCAQLAKAAHKLGLNVWAYTGYTWETLTAANDPDWDALLAEVDVLVDGPFLPEHKSYAALFRGSDNQRLINMKATRATGTVVLWEQPDPLKAFVRPPS